MPRSSEKQRYTKYLVDRLEVLHEQYLQRRQDDEENFIEDQIHAMYLEELQNILQIRYLYREPYRARPYNEFALILHVDNEGNPWLNDTEFLSEYRMRRVDFDRLVGLIENDAIFQSNNNKKQAPPAHQLLVLLKYLGTSASGSNNQSLRAHFKIGRGTVQAYRKRAMLAILRLRDVAITWPNAAERIEISRRIEEKYTLPGCVGIVDGTLFPLAFQPSRIDSPDYSGRKHLYSLSTLIACDDQRRVRYFFAGCPGSAHDNRVFKMSNLYQRAELMFSDRQYTLADSAYECTNHMVSAYRRYANIRLNDRQKTFNRVMAKLRIVSEHTIGMLKGRFQWLRSIPSILNEDEQSLVHIIKYMECCIILHNLLGTPLEEFPVEWLQEIQEMEEQIDVGDEEQDLDDQENIEPNDQLRQDLTNYLVFRNEMH